MRCLRQDVRATIWVPVGADPFVIGVVVVTTIDVYDLKGSKTMMGENMYWNTMWAGHWLWMLVIAIIVVIPAWRICQRTGYPGWMGILILIPLVNLALLYFIAFANWPSDKTGARNG